MPGNLILSSLIKDFYYSLLFNPTHSGPITDDEDMSLRGSYHPRKNPESDRAVGFKLMYDQLEDYIFLKDLIRRENIFLIHLIRNNPLKIHLSKLARRKRGIPHSVNEVEKVRVWVDPKKLTNRLDRIVRDQERMKKTFPDNPYLEITFEDFINDYPDSSKKIWDFLGVNYQCGIRTPKLKKLNPDSVRQIVENYDEIASTLKGTPYEGCLD